MSKEDEYAVEEFHWVDRMPLQEFEDDTSRALDIMKERAVRRLADAITESGCIQFDVQRDYSTMEYVVAQKVKVLRRK